MVTGVSGLLGVNLAWQASGRYDVVGVLRGERAVAAPGRAPFATFLADLLNPGQVDRALDAVRPVAIIHCAALTDVDLCETHPEEAYQANSVLPGRLARAAAGRGVRFVHISTDSVFDGQRGCYTEEDEPRPINTYARTKLEGERAVAGANPDALIARVNFYGWSWLGRRSLSEYFFNNLSVGRPVRGFNDLIFCPLLVNDMVELLLRMLEARLTGLYHVASSESLSKFAFGRMLARAFGFDEALISPASYTTAGLRAPRSPRLTLCCDRLADALGCSLPDQAQAMHRYVELYRQGYPDLLRSTFVEPPNAPF
jgi:dTDP-4-dehydrorhamnose reductase